MRIKRKMCQLTRIAMVIALGLVATPLQADDDSSYHNFDQLIKSIDTLCEKYGHLVSQESLGTTLQNRKIPLLILGNQKGVPLEKRPALLIAAHFEGDYALGSELALYTAEHLVTRYGDDPDVTSALDQYTFYIIPRVSPDAAEARFNGVKVSRMGNFKPIDDDNDGRMDEDGPEDLNGDGFITQMRVADPSGTYMVHPSEGRLMKKADAKEGEAGLYKIYMEGIDNDGDTFINEDMIGGVDINRNFQHQYPYHEQGAGWHMVSEPESRAIMDFVVQHRNIELILCFGASDNLITPPDDRGGLPDPKGVDLITYANMSNADTSKVGMLSQPRSSRSRSFFRMSEPEESSTSGRRRPSRKPETTINSEDIPFFTMISGKYKELTGLKKAPPLRKPAGAFFEYGYFQYGVPSFSTPGWGLPEDESRSEQNSDENAKGDERAERSGRSRGMPGDRGSRGMQGMSGSKGESLDTDLLKWMDAEGIDGFVPWKTFKHPTLGEVEIGGFKPHAVTDPPAKEIAELGSKHAAFALYLTSLFPSVKIAKLEVQAHGGGIYRIKAEIENSGFLPTATAQGVQSRSVKPTMVQLDIPPENLLSGSAKTSFFQALAGSGTRQKYEWILSGNEGQKVLLRVVSQKGGEVSRTLELPSE
jgi:hypothetical protein